MTSICSANRSRNRSKVRTRSAVFSEVNGISRPSGPFLGIAESYRPVSYLRGWFAVANSPLRLSSVIETAASGRCRKRGLTRAYPHPCGGLPEPFHHTRP